MSEGLPLHFCFSFERVVSLGVVVSLKLSFRFNLCSAVGDGCVIVVE